MRTESTTHAHAPASVMSRVAAPSASQARALLVGCTSLYLARARLASTATVDEGALTSLAMMLLAALGAMRRALGDADADARDSATTSYGALAGLAPVWALCAASARASGYSSAAATASAFSAAGSVAYVDAWTPSSAKRAFASAVMWMVAMRVVTGTLASDAVTVATARAFGWGLAGAASERETTTLSLGAAIVLEACVRAYSNAPDGVSEATALACAFALAGVCFLSASARLVCWPEPANGTTRAVVIGAAFVIPELFYRACTKNATNLLAGVVRYTLRTDAESLKTLTALWVSGVVVAATAAYNARAVSLTMRRKAFHLLVVVMFAPTLTRDSAHGELVRVAFAAAFALFAAAECARVFDAYYGVGVFGWKLSLLLAQFVDGRVVSLIILDHFSLLLGIAAPVWMTAVEDTNTLAPWAGLLAVGVGDSFASVVGSSIGRIRVFGDESPKTLEGAIAFAASTFIAARFVGVDIDTVKLAAACVATAACELVDDGVDNFVLPLYFAALVGL